MTFQLVQSFKFRRTQSLADHQGILAGAREGWKASLLFSEDDFMTEFRESITSSISFVELRDWILSGQGMSAKELSRLVRKRGISQC